MAWVDPQACNSRASDGIITPDIHSPSQCIGLCVPSLSRDRRPKSIHPSAGCPAQQADCSILIGQADKSSCNLANICKIARELTSVRLKMACLTRDARGIVKPRSRPATSAKAATILPVCVSAFRSLRPFVPGWSSVIWPGLWYSGSIYDWSRLATWPLTGISRNRLIWRRGSVFQTFRDECCQASSWQPSILFFLYYFCFLEPNSLVQKRVLLQSDPKPIKARLNWLKIARPTCDKSYYGSV